MTRTVVTMPGDGIGRIVIPEAIRVLRAVGFDADFVHAEIGWDCWVRDGNALPSRTVGLLETHGLGLFGAITSKTTPELRGRGYVSPVLAMRKRLGMEVAIRPCRTLPGNPRNFVRRRNGSIDEPSIDVAIVMQNTEGLFSGVEWAAPSAELRRALDAHPEMKRFRETPSDDLAVSCRITTRGASLRIARAAFEYASARGYRSVTLCDKWGVMSETASLLLSAAQEVAKDFPKIEFATSQVDSQVMWLTRRPERFGVILCEALIGDILSDGFAGLVGGMGFTACANLGPRCAVFEPVHGSAPHYAEIDPPIVNPIAAILAGAMLLEHVGEGVKAARIRKAVESVVLHGQVRTFDMLDRPGPAATTPEMTDAIVTALEQK